MANIIKFYAKNRFMWLGFVWVAVLCLACSCDPHISVCALAVGLMCIIGCFGYIDECCSLQAQERLFLKKLNNCLGF